MADIPNGYVRTATGRILPMSTMPLIGAYIGDKRAGDASAASGASSGGSSNTTFQPGQGAIFTQDPTVNGPWTHTRADIPLFKQAPLPPASSGSVTTKPATKVPTTPAPRPVTPAPVAPAPAPAMASPTSFSAPQASAMRKSKRPLDFNALRSRIANTLMGG